MYLTSHVTQLQQPLAHGQSLPIYASIYFIFFLLFGNGSQTPYQFLYSHIYVYKLGHIKNGHCTTITP